MNVVVAHSVTDDVRAPDFAAVILDLVIALNRGLRCEKAGAGEEILPLEEQADWEIGEWLSAPRHRVSQHVHKLQIFESDAVGVSAGI